MNLNNEVIREAQVNTLYRLQQLCKQYGFQKSQQPDVSMQFKAAVAAPK